MRALFTKVAKIDGQKIDAEAIDNQELDDSIFNEAHLQAETQLPFIGISADTLEKVRKAMRHVAEFLKYSPTADQINKLNGNNEDKKRCELIIARQKEKISQAQSADAKSFKNQQKLSFFQIYKDGSTEFRSEIMRKNSPGVYKLGNCGEYAVFTKIAILLHLQHHPFFNEDNVRMLYIAGGDHVVVGIGTPENFKNKNYNQIMIIDTWVKLINSNYKIAKENYQKINLEEIGFCGPMDEYITFLNDNPWLLNKKVIKPFTFLDIQAPENEHLNLYNPAIYNYAKVLFIEQENCSDKATASTEPLLARNMETIQELTPRFF